MKKRRKPTRHDFLSHKTAFINRTYYYYYDYDDDDDYRFIFCSAQLEMRVCANLLLIINTTNRRQRRCSIHFFHEENIFKKESCTSNPLNNDF